MGMVNAEAACSMPHILKHSRSCFSDEVNFGTKCGVYSIFRKCLEQPKVLKMQKHSEKPMIDYVAKRIAPLRGFFESSRIHAVIFYCQP